MPHIPVPINVPDETRITLERAAGDRYNVRVNGRFSGTLDKEHDTLQIDGSGNNAVLEIPGNIAIDPHDFIPRLQINTTAPLNIGNGAGEFILEKGTARMTGAAADLNKATVTLNTGDARLADNDRVMKWDSANGALQAVVIPDGGGTLEIVNGHTKEVTYSISGKDSLDKNLADLKPLQEPERAPATRGPAQSYIDIPDGLRQAATQISLMKNTRDSSGRNISARTDELGQAFNRLQSAADAILNNANKKPNIEKMGELQKAMDGLVKTTSEYSSGKDASGRNRPGADTQTGSMLQGQIKSLQTKVNAAMPQQRSMAPADPLATLAAAAQIHPSIKPQTSIHLEDGTSVSASSTQINPANNQRTV